MSNETQASLGKLYKGSDLKVPFRYEGSNGPIDLNDLSGILVILYYESDGSTLQTYDTGTNYEEIVFDDASNGEFHLKIQSTTTSNAAEGWIIGEVKIADNDQDWDNSIFNDILKTRRLFNIVDSKTASTTV